VALASAEDVMTKAVGVIMIPAVAEADWLGLLLSVTVAVKVEAPLACAMPETVPDGVRVKPVGSEPVVIFQE
jgi:hypothetical protein